MKAQGRSVTYSKSQGIKVVSHYTKLKYREKQHKDEKLTIRSRRNNQNQTSNIFSILSKKLKGTKSKYTVFFTYRYPLKLLQIHCEHDFCKGCILQLKNASQINNSYLLDMQVVSFNFFLKYIYKWVMPSHCSKIKKDGKFYNGGLPPAHLLPTGNH